MIKHKRNMLKEEKKGQTTIFIIIGIIIVAAVLLFFILRNNNGPSTPGISSESAPETFLGTCLEDKVYETIFKISEQGGYVDPTQVKYKTYQLQDESTTTDIAYLCYNRNYYGKCMNREPVLFKHIEEEIKKEISPDLRNCFNQYGISLENEGYVVNAWYQGFNLSMKENSIQLDLNASLVLTKSEETSRFENIEIRFDSELYQLVRVVHDIVSQTSNHCDFNILGYKIMHPRSDIRRAISSDSTEIYRVEDKKTNKYFKFAMRGCVAPSGFG